MLPNISGGLAGIGQGLGTAHGSITIDTSDLSRARAEAQASGRAIGQALQQGIGGGARNALQGLRDLRDGVQSLNRELTVIGAGAGVLTGFGLGAARDLRAYRIAYETLLGSQREGDRIMRQLTASASEYGLEMESVLGLGRALIPILGENVDQTGEWVTRAARLRAVLPTAQQGAELRAITEYLADQTISLQRLFNIPPELIQEARAQFADAGQQLDFILDKMGATEEAAQRMADPMVSLKNELKLIAAIGFTPLLEDLRGTASQFREWLETVRETNPEILKIGANAIAAVAAGAPLVLFLNQVAGLLLKIKSVGPLVALGKAGLLVGGAAFVAREGVRAFGRATGNEDQADISYRGMLAAAFAAFTHTLTSVALVMARVSQAFYDGVYSMVGAMGRFIETVGTIAVRIGNILPERLGGARLREFGESLQERGQTIADNAEQWRQNAAELVRQAQESMIADMTRVIETFGRWVGALPRGPETRRGPETSRGGRPEPQQSALSRLFADTIANAVPGGLAEWSRFWGELSRIQQEAEAEILAAEEEAARQRAEIIAAYDLRLTRDAEDFARQRARAEEDYQRQIDDINADRIEREAEWQQELNERLERISADAARERERMEEDHQDNLLSAASRLDARAVAEEQRRYNRQRTRFEEDLQQRIDDERAAHQERIAQAREADEERLADLAEFHERRKAREDEDRAVRLARMEEDHEAQLAQFDEQQERRIQQIRDQATEERVAAAEAYRERLRELGVHYTAMITEQARSQGDILSSWTQFWRNMENQVVDTSGDRRGGETGRGGNRPSRQELEQQAIDLMQQNNWQPQTIYNQTRAWRQMSDAELARWLEQTFGIDVPGYLLGTPFVPQTGLAMLHRGEMVLPPGMAEMARNAGIFNGMHGASSSSISYDNRRLSIAPGAIVVHAAPGQSAQDIGAAVRREIIKIADEVRR